MPKIQLSVDLDLEDEEFIYLKDLLSQGTLSKTFSYVVKRLSKGDRIFSDDELLELLEVLYEPEEEVSATDEDLFDGIEVDNDEEQNNVLASSNDLVEVSDDDDLFNDVEVDNDDEEKTEETIVKDTESVTKEYIDEKFEELFNLLKSGSVNVAVESKPKVKELKQEDFIEDDFSDLDVDLDTDDGDEVKQFNPADFARFSKMLHG